MKKLKTILLYNTSKYGHITLIISIFLFASKHPYLYIVGIVYLIYIYFKSKYLILVILIIAIIIGIRYNHKNQVNKQTLPIKAEVIDINKNYIIIKSKYKYIVYIDNPQQFQPGMIVHVEGEYLEYDQSHVEHTFNYTEYLKTQNIIGRIVPNNISVLSQRFNVNIISFHIKNYIDDQYENIVSTYMKLFILGYKDDLDDSITKQSSDLGISHLFAISGMHLGLIVFIVNKILQLFYMKKQSHHLILIIFLLVYNVITGFTISIIRASLFLFIILLTNERRIMNASDYLSFIFIAFVIYNPYIIFNLGFQLSFLMTFVLILFNSFYTNIKGVKKIFLISIIAFIFSFPITISINKNFGLFNAFVNPLFIVYVSFILLPGAFILLIIPGLSTLYMNFVLSFETLIYQAINYNMFINFNFSNSISKLFFWLLITLSLVYFKNYKKRIAIVWLVFILFISQTIIDNNSVKVVLFDVNQGDATYIQTGDCKLLIDTGKADDYDTLIHYFKGENIHSLDGIVLSHQHQDHYGEVNDILSAIDVKKLFVSRIYEDLEPSIQEVVYKGNVINCGTTVLHVLNSDQGFSNENNNSLVLFTIIKGESWLFTGDIESKIEEMMVKEYDFKIDHLKVAHHGSNTSSTKEFLQHFQPKFAYISVGKNNYNLPDEKTLANIYEEVDNIYITKEIGSIINVYRELYRFKYFYYNGRKEYEIVFNI